MRAVGVAKGLPGTIAGPGEAASFGSVTVAIVALGDDQGTLGNVSGAQDGRSLGSCQLCDYVRLVCLQLRNELRA